MRIGDGRVEELHLDPDDRMEPDRLGGRGEPDDPVEALVVGDRQAGQPELGRPFDELVRGGRPVEEREVRVAVELGIGDRTGHRISVSGAEARSRRVAAPRSVRCIWRV